MKASLSRSSSPTPPIGSFDRVRKYRPPPTSFHSSVQYLHEEFGAPRTSQEVKKAYLNSHPNTDDEAEDSHSPVQLNHASPQISTPSLCSSPTSQSSVPARMTENERDFDSPAHGRGSAAAQGAALREAADREVGRSTSHASQLKHVNGSARSSPRQSLRVSPRESPRHTPRGSISRARQGDLQHDDEKHADHHYKRRSKRYSRDVNTEQVAPGSAAAQGAAFRKGEDPVLPDKEQTREARERHLRAAYGDTPKLGKGSAPKPPVYPMTGLDNLALLMEDDSYTTSCFSIYMFKTELDLETVDNFFEVLAETYPKYRYVVDLDPKESKRLEREQAKLGPEKSPSRQFDAGRKTRYGKGLKAGSLFAPARWRFRPDFDIKENIEHVAQCPDGGDEAALNKLAGKFIARHFDYSKPIWEALVVNGLNTSDGGRSALMIKIHHCFSDGQGMIQSYHAALGALEAGVGIRDIQRKVDSSQSHKKPGQREEKPTIGGTIKHGFHMTRGLYFRSRKSFLYQTKRKRVAGRLYCHSEGIRMDDIKMIRKAYSTDKMNLTLNDVACAILSRALRIASERVDPERRKKDKRVAVFVPISIRPKGDWSLSNFTTGTIAWFRFEEEENPNFEEQLSQVHREMGRIKRSHLPKIMFKLFDAYCKRRITYLPNYPLLRQFYYRAFREYHVATNVPGPPKPVKFGDHEAYSYHVLPPSSPGKATMAIGMISYANDFSLAVSCDDVPEFEHLAEEICKAFQDASHQIIEAAHAKMGQNKEAAAVTGQSARP